MKMRRTLLLLMVWPVSAMAGGWDVGGFEIGDPESGMRKADKLFEKNGAVYYRAPRGKSGDYALAGVPVESAALAFESGRLARIELTTSVIRPGKDQYCFEAENVVKIEKELARGFGRPVLQARVHSGPESFRILADEYKACRTLRDDVNDCEIAVFEKWPDAKDKRQHALEAVLNSAMLGKRHEGGDEACLVRVVYRQGKHIDPHPDKLMNEFLDLMGD